MSKQTGLIRLKGTIGGVSFYKSEGEDLARIASGPDKTRINNDPAFQRTRENNREFGGSATVAKALRISLTYALQGTADSRLVSRLTQLFKKINAKGTGARGQRSIALSANGSMLVNLEFNRRTSFSSIFNAPFTASGSGDRKSGQINVIAFSPGDFIKAPAGATHFRLIQALGVVSDYLFDSDAQAYEPISPELNTTGAISYSDYTTLTGTAPVSFSLSTVIWACPLKHGAHNVIEALKIAIQTFHPHQLVSLLVSDGGSENNALSVEEWLEITKDPKITKLIALKDIAFSNSPIEAVHKIMKRYIRRQEPQNFQQLLNGLPKHVLDYTSIRPHGSINGYTPLEAYAQKAVSMDFSEQTRRARNQRINLNKVQRCKTCS